MPIQNNFVSLHRQTIKTSNIMAKYNSIKEVLTKEFLSDWLSTATYGSFWCDCSVHKDTSDEIYDEARNSNNCREDKWADVLLNGGSLNICDIEECEEGNEEGEHKMALADIEKALPLFILNYPTQWAAIMDETYDLYDADALLQFVVFGDVIYG